MDISSKVSLASICEKWIRDSQNSQAIMGLSDVVVSALPSGINFGGNDILYKMMMMIGMGVVVPIVQQQRNETVVAFVMQSTTDLPLWCLAKKAHDRLYNHVDMILTALSDMKAMNQPTAMLLPAIEQALIRKTVVAFPREPKIDPQYDLALIRSYTKKGE
jgi:hypothetical protein